MTFEESLKELEATVRKLEVGQMTLDESIAAFTRGKELVEFCTGELTRLEQKIEQLTKLGLQPITPPQAQP